MRAKELRKGEHQNKLLIARHHKGESGSLPEHVPTAFLADCIKFTRMFVTGGTACTVHGFYFQEEMATIYPAQWMLWLFDEVGLFTGDWLT